jgi:hypothetical protein
MKRKNHLEVAATIVLGVICTLLILRLIVRVRSVSAGTTGGVASSPLPAPVIRRFARLTALPQKDSTLSGSPVLNVQLFDQLQQQPMATPDRDPFSFAPTAEQVQELKRQKEQVNANRVTGPPPPPPVPLKALGYVQDAAGQLQAYLTDSDSVYAVREGEKFDKVYRVLKITPAFVEIEDQTLNLRAQLAIPQ